MCSVLFISPSLTRRAGGIFEVAKSLAQHLAAADGLSVEAVGLEDPANRGDLDAWSPVRTSVFSFRGPASFGYSPQLLAWIDGSTHDLAHLHALWMYTSVATHRWARRQGKPYIVTPNGMLEPWALRNSKWKKRLARLFYEDRMLRGAACLHANTMKELRRYPRLWAPQSGRGHFQWNQFAGRRRGQRKSRRADVGCWALVQSAFISRAGSSEKGPRGTD